MSTAPHADTTVDLSLIMPLDDEGVDIRDQLEDIKSRYSMHSRKLVALPNARPGRGYQPVSGYVLVIDSKAPMLNGVFDVNALFKGRVLVALVDTKVPELVTQMTRSGLDSSQLFSAIEKKIPPEAMLELLHKARKTALDMNRAAAERDSSVVALHESETPCVTPTFSIIKKSFGFEVPYLLYEDHVTIHSPDGVSVLEERLHAAVEAGQTVDDFFFSNDMKRYYNTQLIHRSLVVHLMRSFIIEAIMGRAAVKELGLDDLSFQSARHDSDAHQVVNMIYNNRDGDLVYYSNAIKATTSGGALVTSGPFNAAVWVNRRSQTIGRLQEANLESAVPYHLPTLIPRALAIEEVVDELESSSDRASSKVREPQSTTIAGVVQVKDDVHWLLTEPEGRTSLGVATLILPEKQNGVRVVVPDLHRRYREGLESASGWNILQSCGVARDVELNEPFQPIVTVIDHPNVLDTLELWKIKLKLAINEQAMK